MDAAAPIPHSVRTDDLVRLVEKHACNATLHAIGRPEIGPEDWMKHCGRVAGGFIGRIAWSDGMEAFTAFVPAGDDDPGKSARIPEGTDIGAWPDSILPRRLRRIVETLASLAGGKAVEASTSIGDAGVDLVRGTVRLPWTAAPRTARKQTSPLKAGNASALAERIRSGKGDDGFLLSVTDRWEFLAIVAGNGTLSETEVLQSAGKLSLRGIPLSPADVPGLAEMRLPDRIPLFAVKVD